MSQGPMPATASPAERALRIIAAHGADDRNGLPMAVRDEEMPKLIFGGADAASNVREGYALDPTLQALFGRAVAQVLGRIARPVAQTPALAVRRHASPSQSVLVSPARRSWCSGARDSSLRDAVATAARARARTGLLHAAAGTETVVDAHSCVGSLRALVAVWNWRSLHLRSQTLLMSFNPKRRLKGSTTAGCVLVGKRVAPPGKRRTCPARADWPWVGMA